MLVDARSGRTEHSLAAKVHNDLLVGYNFTYDFAGGNLERYDAGLSWTPVPKVTVGLKHESVDKLNVSLGKELFYLHHVASSVNTVGTEFSINWANSIVSARAGLSHQFNDETSGKLRVDQDGNVDAALKHRFNNNVTAGVVFSNISLL